MEVTIGGVAYVPRNSTDMTDEVRRLLNSLYGKIWTEACYDPDNFHTKRYADRLLDDIQRLNELLKFKT
jgi:hypothetical protein